MKKTKKQIIIDYIISKLDNSEWKPCDRLPSENQLAEELNVSRVTVRDALIYLSTNDYIVKVNNSGHFVNENFIPHNKKTIVIVNRLSDLSYVEGYYPRKLMDYFEEYVNLAGYNFNILINPSLNKGNIENYLSKDIIKASNIIGVITNVFDDISTNKLLENNIPIVSVTPLSTNSLHSVSCNYFDWALKTKDLLTKHKITKYLVCSYDLEFSNNPETFIISGVVDCISDDDKNKVIKIGPPWYNTLKPSQQAFIEKLEKLDYIPEALVFTDDSLFEAICPILKEIDVLKNIKIITHSNNGRIFPIDFEVCKVEFNIKEIAQKAWELLEKLINGEPVLIPCEYVEAKIINEHILDK